MAEDVGVVCGRNATPVVSENPSPGLMQPHVGSSSEARRGVSGRQSSRRDGTRREEGARDLRTRGAARALVDGDPELDMAQAPDSFDDRLLENRDADMPKDSLTDPHPQVRFLCKCAQRYQRWSCTPSRRAAACGLRSG
jgi:hypothetical protein